MKIFSKVLGAGPTLVFNHGWTMSHRFFQKQEALSQFYRLVLWDLPGHGQSEKRTWGYPLADCAAALKQLVEEHNIESAVAVGWSMGNDVFWEYFRRYGPGPFSSFLMVDSIPWGEEKRYRVTATEHALKKDREQAARKFIKRMFYQLPEAAELDWMVAEALRVPLEISMPFYREIAVCDYRPVAWNLKIPFDFWMGRYGFHADQGDEIALEFPQASVQWFETSGHMPFWEQPEMFNRKIRESY